MKLVLETKRFLLIIYFLFFFLIAFSYIQSDFAVYYGNLVAIGIGRLFLCFDILLVLYLLITYKSVLPQCSIAVFLLVGYQIITMLFTDGIDVFALSIRYIAWALLFVSIYRISLSFKNKINYVLRIALLLTIILAIIISWNEINTWRLLNSFSSGINTVYWVELFLPLALLIDKKPIKIFFICLIGIATLLSLKVTAVFSFVVPLLIGFSFDLRKKRGKINSGIVVAIVAVTIGYLMFSYFEQFFTSFLGFNWIMKFTASYDSGGSGRLDIWKNVLELLSTSNVLNIIFGHGHEAVRNNTISHLSAHNDFLEVLYDYGIIGFSLYLLVYYKLISLIRKCMSKDNKIVMVLVVSVSQFFIMSMFSHLIIYPRLLLTIAITWGICFAYKDSYIEEP